MKPQCLLADTCFQHADYIKSTGALQVAKFAERFGKHNCFKYTDSCEYRKTCFYSSHIDICSFIFLIF